MSSFPSDLEIARKAHIRPIKEIAAKLGIEKDTLHPFGRFMAKLPLHLQDDEKISRSKLILVTAINPTPAGEGKTTVSVGLTDGLNRIGEKTIAALREPSLGPVFGMKGGAAGGGYAQVIPMEDINLHFTGDFSAVEKANNLLAALIDNNLQNPARSLNIDPRTITWKRVMDMNDRALRKITIGLGGTANGIPREDGFNITPASEVMAILCLSRDLEDLKTRLGKILVGFTYDKKPVYARDLKAENAMAILLRDAIKPNLVQTLEGNAAILHGGPFANIAQGTNSIIATRTALSLADYVVTEAGFGADLGAEKFFHIKCLYGNLKPAAVVMVATLRALRHHGGADKKSFQMPDPDKVRKGFSNLAKHLENMKKFGFTPVVAVNRYPEDRPDELEVLNELCGTMGVRAVSVTAFAEGGRGAEELAREIVRMTERNGSFTPLFTGNETVQTRIETIAREIYGANEVNYSSKALNQLKQLRENGADTLPVCMAKTQKSLSDNEKLIGRPENFSVTVRELEWATGAGFIIPILGEIMRMPGLPAVPASEHMDIDAAGNISGLS
jgi:formate--tetrahydrofolate ligase